MEARDFNIKSKACDPNRDVPATNDADAGNTSDLGRAAGPCPARGEIMVSPKAREDPERWDGMS